jgi:predicted transcriptional regulator of viral defense system
MNFHEFRNKWFDLGCVSSNQVYSWQPNFDKNNMSHWSKKGLLIKLRNGFYTFPEYKIKSGFAWYIANRIYRPSYVSLHTALAFYGMIPESVVQVTSVTSMKTATFTNALGEFTYRSVRPDLMFGYDVKSMAEGGSLHLAKPEKALLDLLYLYPFYNTTSEIEELRLDSDFIQNDLNMDVLNEFSRRFNCKALEKRIKLVCQ